MDGDAVRRAFVLVALVVVLAGGAVATVLFSTAPAGSPPHGSTDPAEGAEVAAALGVLASDPQAAIAAGALAEIDGRVAEAVPSGSLVRPFAETWAPDGVGGGTMVVEFSVPGGTPESFLVVLVPEDGTWKVLATVPMVEEP